MNAATLWDLAGLGQLEGKRVRFIADDGSWAVRRGDVGTVLRVSTSEPRALVEYVHEDRPERSAFRTTMVESPFDRLELVRE
jgi:hypothetical protein